MNIQLTSLIVFQNPSEAINVLISFTIMSFFCLSSRFGSEINASDSLIYNFEDGFW